jgi:TIR domain
VSEEDYVNDVFLSYTSKDPVGSWVRNHFAPLLESWLYTYSGRDPKLFLDRNMEVGVQWPEALRDNLLRSRCLVAVWSPPYFLQSRWCMAEWRSMREREDVLGLGRGIDRGLIYPVIFADGELFPEDARQTQARDLSRYNKPHLQYRDTPEFLEFDTEVQTIAQDLVRLLNSVPPWQPGWPIVESELEPKTTLSLPRLR